jgi:hypothetical protein
MKLMSTGRISVIDPSLYILLRFLIIVLDRTVNLFYVSRQWTTTNSKFMVFNKLEMQKPTADNCFDQFKLKKQLFQEIDDLSTQTET